MTRLHFCLALSVFVLFITGRAVALAGDTPAVSVVRVLDDAGAPLLGRVVITRYGQAQPDMYVAFTDAAGACSLSEVPPGPARVEVFCGSEWQVVGRDVVVVRDGGELPVMTHRLFDLRARGYYEGDGHMHSTYSDGAQRPAEVAHHCRCEGLSWAFLTDHDTLAGHAEFMAAATGGFLPMGGQEITTSKGHILGLGVMSLVSRDVSHGAEDMARIFREVHAQGGVVVVAHPTTPGMSYQFWEVEGYDALEILNGSLPPYGWLFERLQGRGKWLQLLAAGKRIAALGNSDNHDNYSRFAQEVLRDPQDALKRQPALALLWNLPERDTLLVPWAKKGLHLGMYRTGLRLPELSQGAVLEALRAGRGYVSNGPILVATANGADPGAEIAGPTVTVGFDAVCNRGLERVDLRADGEIVGSVDVSGKLVASGEVAINVGEARSLVVECRGVWPEFATTNAWYVTN